MVYSRNNYSCRLVRLYTAVLLVVSVDPCCSQLLVPGKRNRTAFGYVREGDVNIGQLVGFTAGSNCDVFQYSGVLYSKVVQFAVGQVNRRSDLLPNVTLGFVQMDDCWDDLSAIEAAVYLTAKNEFGLALNMTSCEPITRESLDGSIYPKTFDVFGVVGPATSDLLAAVSRVLGVFQIPTIGLIATANSLSEKAEYPYTLRMVSPDLAGERAMLEVARYMGWTYVSMVYSAGTYGDGAFNDIQMLLRTTAADLGICLAVTVRIPQHSTASDFEDAVDKLTSDPAARVVLAYLQAAPNQDMPGLFNAVRKRVGTGWFLWLGSDSFNGLSRQDYADVIDGAIYVTPPAGNPIPGFRQFLESLPWTGADTLDTNPKKDCNGEDMWFQQFWKVVTGCNTTVQCQSLTSLNASAKPVRYIWSIMSRAYDATNVFVRALHKTIDENCPDVFAAPQQTPLHVRDCVRGDKLLENLLNTTMSGVVGEIAFDSNGDLLGSLVITQLQRRQQSSGGKAQSTVFDEVQIGTVATVDKQPIINASAISWSAFSTVSSLPSTPLTADGLMAPTSTPVSNRSRSQDFVKSVCSRPCRADEYVVQLSVSCCWRCQSCRPNEIVSANGTGCRPCPLYTWPAVSDQTVTRNGSSPQDNAMACFPITPTYLDLSDSLAVVLVTAAAVLLSITLTIMVIYAVKRDHRLIKATSRELSAVVMSGCLLASLTAISYAMRPTDVLCSFRNVAFHISTNLLYAPLLVKTVRIYRIFTAAKLGAHKPAYTSGLTQIGFTSGIVAVQVAFSMISELLDRSNAALNQPASYVNYVELYCYKSVAWFLVQLAYNFAIMLACSALGFKARRLPENFNDSQFIFVSVATTLFVWILFIPAYFTAYYAYVRTEIIGFCLVSIVGVTLVCQFVRIAYAVFFVPSDRIKFSFDGNETNAVTPSTSRTVPSLSTGMKLTVVPKRSLTIRSQSD